MRKIILITIILIIVFSIVGILIISNNDSINLNFGACKIEETRETPVSLELAKSVASDQVHRNNPPFNWTYVGDYLVYNSFGDTNYYLLIFRKSDFMTLDSLEKLEQNAKLFSDSTSEESDKKYQPNDIATVMTGTMKEDVPLQSHYRGIPEAIAKRLEIKEIVENNYPGKTIGNLIADSPMGQVYYEIIDKNSNKPYSKWIRAGSPGDFLIVSRSERVQLKKHIQDRKEQSYSTYEDEECQKFQSANLEAEQAHIAKWNEFE
ncbi:MAG: hypothetical protein KKA64_02370 [Nanoarchaeota archaeon]|nr:hypothetical protein [Nanoarchaeota archaeon]